MKKMFLVLLIIPLSLFAQDTTTMGITIPTGFNWFYILFFAVGMFVHYAVKVFHDLGSAKFMAGIVSNFAGWFLNKPHWTLLAGAAAAIMGFAASYGLPVAFATLNALAIAVSIAAGYIADSAFNGGEIK